MIIADRTAESLKNIITCTRAVSNLVSLSYQTSNEQASGLRQSGIGLAQVDEVAQEKPAQLARVRGGGQGPFGASLTGAACVGDVSNRCPWQSLSVDGHLWTKFVAKAEKQGYDSGLR